MSIQTLLSFSLYNFFFKSFVITFFGKNFEISFETQEISGPHEYEGLFFSLFRAPFMFFYYKIDVLYGEECFWISFNTEMTKQKRIIFIKFSMLNMALYIYSLYLRGLRIILLPILLHFILMSAIIDPTVKLLLHPLQILLLVSERQTYNVKL